MRNKIRKPKKNLLDQYNEKQTKGNVENTLLKSAVDTVAGSVVGTGIGAIAGDKAAFAGIVLILAGHYMGDESGLLRLTGVSTMAYGIGKSSEYKTNPELQTAGQRISALKDDWLTAFHLKWQKETNQKPIPSEQKTRKKESSVPIDSASQNSTLDVSGLAEFENTNQDLANSEQNGKRKNQETPSEINNDFIDDIDISLI